MRFEFGTATRILFGPGAVRDVPAAAAEMGRRVLVAAGTDASRAAALLEQLGAAGLAVDVCPVSSEPTIDSVTAGVARARELGADVIIGIGGGSTIDTGKAIAALLTNGGEPLDYLEVLGRGKPLTQPAAPYIAIP